MTGIVLLDVALGVIYVFLVFSLVASALQEALAGIFGWRAAALRTGVRQMLGEKFDDIWQSPLIDVLKGPSLRFTNTRQRDPSYIKSSHFARAVLEELDLAGKSPAEIVSAIESDTSGAFGGTSTWLRATMRNAGDKAEAAELALAGYFDEVMERVSGWYVRRAKFCLVAIGFGLAAFTNFNVFDYTSTLIRDKDARDAAVASAMQAAAYQHLGEFQDKLGTGATQQAADVYDDLGTYFVAQQEFFANQKDILAQETGALGWDCSPTPPLRCIGQTLTKVYPPLSWALMALAVMLGAQFWFDMLQKVVSVRSAGVSLVKKHSAKEENAT